MGIPRLRMPKDAPSRSTLKLAEAILTLLTDEQKATLRPGLQAVDLGAAPGGWSWQLVSRGLRVTAIDNGPMAPSVAATGLIEHLRADGFTWKPQARRMDGLRHGRAALAHRPADGRLGSQRALPAQHLQPQAAHEAPPREVERCRALIDQRMRAAGIKYILRIKHLYHDREEVTCYLTRR
jgi:23S rRNA (cytidine2498-2'-O)-methyltransferase